MLSSEASHSAEAALAPAKGHGRVVVVTVGDNGRDTLTFQAGRDYEHDLFSYMHTVAIYLGLLDENEDPPTEESLRATTVTEVVNNEFIRKRLGPMMTTIVRHVSGKCVNTNLAVEGCVELVRKKPGTTGPAKPATRKQADECLKVRFRLFPSDHPTHGHVGHVRC